MAGTKKRASARKSSTAKRSRAIVVARPANSLDSLFGRMDLDLGLGSGLGGGLGGGLGIGSLGMGSDIYARSMIMPQLLDAKLMEHKFAMAVRKAKLKGAIGMKEWQMEREIKAQEAAINAVSDMVKKRQANYEEAVKLNNNPYLTYLNTLKKGINEAIGGSNGAGSSGGGGMIGPAPAAAPFTDYDGYGGGYEGFSGGGLDDYSGYGDGDLDLFSGQYY